MAPFLVQCGRYAPCRACNSAVVARATRPCFFFLLGEDTGGSPVPPVHSVALVITTLCILSNKYVFNPCATFTGAQCSETRFGVRPLTSTQYTASGTLCEISA